MIKRLFKIDSYPNLLQQQQASMIAGITLILIIAYTFYTAFLPSSIFAPRTTLQYFIDTANINFFIRVGIFYALGGATLFILRRQNLNLASWVAFIMWCVLTVGFVAETGVFNGFNTVALLLTILFGGLFLGRKGVWIGLVITLIALNLTILNRANLSDELLPAYIVSAEALAKSGTSDALALSFI